MCTPIDIHAREIRKSAYDFFIYLPCCVAFTHLINKAIPIEECEHLIGKLVRGNAFEEAGECSSNGSLDLLPVIIGKPHFCLIVSWRHRLIADAC